jgi:hypothetical protein
MDNILSTINYVLNLEIDAFEEYVCDQWNDETFTPRNKHMLDRALLDSNIDHMYKTAYLAGEEYVTLVAFENKVKSLTLNQQQQSAMWK